MNKNFCIPLTFKEPQMSNLNETLFYVFMSFEPILKYQI